MASNPGQIPAGGKDKISVVVGTHNRGGQTITKHFRVFTDDPANPMFNLVVHGKILAYVEVTPPRIRFNGQLGDNLTQEVRIVPQNGHLFKIKEAKANSGKNIKLDLKPLGKVGKEPSKEGYLLTVTCTRKEKGVFSDLIVVKTDLKEKEMITIPVSGHVLEKEAAKGRKVP